MRYRAVTGRMLVFSALVFGACGGRPLGGAVIHGSGSLPAVLGQTWSVDFRRLSGATVVLAPAGSAAAAESLSAGNAAVATIGDPLTDREIAAIRNRGEPVHIPLVLSPLALAYDITDFRDKVIRSGLRFDSGTLAVMLRGRIENWVNIRILALNAQSHLPDELISVCHRTDPAATTSALSGYLSRRSKWWRQGVGASEQVTWKVLGGFHFPMLSARGDQGMVRCLKTRYGSFGYLDAAEAGRNRFTVARVRNRAGRFVSPTAAGAMAAVASTDPPADLRFSALDAPARDAYPITAVRFALVWQDMCRAGLSKRVAKTVKAWLDYVLSVGGQQIARRLGYAPLPPPIRAAAQSRVDALACDGRQIG